MKTPGRSAFGARQHGACSASRPAIRRPFSIAIGLLALAASVSCGGEKTFLGCPVDEANAGTAGIMRDVYFWNDEIDQWSKYSGLAPASYDDPDHLLDFLRYRPSVYDRDFSYIDSVEADEAFNAGDEFYMFGFLFDLPDEDTMVIQMVLPFSPAEAAGLRRGDRVLRINSRTITQILDGEGIDEALGFFEPDVSRVFEIERAGATNFEVAIATAPVPLPPIVPRPSNLSDPLIFDVPGGRTVGYLPFFLFVDTAESALDQIFAAFKAANVSDVVVDLRYSPGGLVSIAEHLGALLAGPANVGEVQYRLIANSANSAENLEAHYESRTQSVSLDSIVFITTGLTASAGELVINSLDVAASGIEVVLVGTRSFGKPVGSAGFDFCDDVLRLRPIAFEIRNSEDQGQYFDGLSVDCEAADDLDYAMGDPDEDSLFTALHYIETGECPLSAVSAAELESQGDERPRRTEGRGWLRARADL